jgi:hypothetical protein
VDVLCGLLVVVPPHRFLDPVHALLQWQAFRRTVIPWTVLVKRSMPPVRGCLCATTTYPQVNDVLDVLYGLLHVVLWAGNGTGRVAQQLLCSSIGRGAYTTHLRKI